MRSGTSNHALPNQQQSDLCFMVFLWFSSILPLSYRVLSLASDESINLFPKFKWINPEEYGPVNHINGWELIMQQWKAHPSLGDPHNIFITHLIITIKSEVSIFPTVVIFFRGCVPEVFVLSYAVGSIYILEKLGFASLITAQSYDVRI